MKIRPLEALFFLAGMQTERQTNMKIYIVVFRDFCVKNNNKQNYKDYFIMDHRKQQRVK